MGIPGDIEDPTIFVPRPRERRWVRSDFVTSDPADCPDKMTAAPAPIDPVRLNEPAARSPDQCDWSRPPAATPMVAADLTRRW